MIAFDAPSTSGYNTADDVYSWSHTCSGGNRYLLVGVSMLSVGGSSVSGITYNGVTLSKLGSQASVSGAVRTELWGLANPASGSHSVEVTLSTALDSIGSALSASGVGTNYGYSSATATNVGAADATVNQSAPPSGSNWFVIDCIATSDTAITVGAGQIEKENVTGTLGSGAMSTEGPVASGTTTMSWTGVGALATWSIGTTVLIPTSTPTLDAEKGAYTLTGVAAGLTRPRTIVGGTGSYVLTGKDASLKQGYSITASTGSYTLTGQDAALTKTRPLAAGTGSYVLTGIAAGLRDTSIIVADAGAYTLTGKDVSLLANQPLVAGTGVYTLTGIDVGLRTTEFVTADAGSYVVIGQDTIGRQGFSFTIGAGTFTLSGQTIGLRKSVIRMAAATGHYTLTGRNTAHLLVAQTGVYSYEGFGIRYPRATATRRRSRFNYSYRFA